VDSDAVMPATDAKVLRYEAFLNDQLKPDLKAILEKRDKLYEEIAEFLALKNSIGAIRAAELRPGQPLKTKVDLGCNFYVQARVPDPSRLFLEVGLGFFVELTLDEALKVIERKTRALEGRATALTQDACKVKANIKLTLEGLRELQRLAAEDMLEKKRRGAYDPLQ